MEIRETIELMKELVNVRNGSESKNRIDDIEKRLQRLEIEHAGLKIKIGGFVAGLSIVFTLIAKYIVDLIGGKP